MRFSALLPSPLALALLAAMVGCNGKDTVSDSTPESQPPDSDPPVVVDADGDGVTEADGDCDDANADVHPGRTEDCNGVDDNCNGLTDEGYGDADTDGEADCIDTEDCDGVDNDGDGVVDEGYGDADGDGVADCVGTEACDGVDNDGDGDIDEGYDADGDGYTQCGTDGEGGTDEDLIDCDDSDPDVYPDGEEASGDLTDNDCDGLVDEGDWEEGDLVITEIMNNPALVSDVYGEWFEVVNVSERTVFLNGLVITSSDGVDRHRVDSDTLLTLAPGEYFVFGALDDPEKNGGVDVGYQYKNVTLGNEADDLILKVESLVIDEVAWDDGVVMPDPSGASMMLDPGFIGASLNDTPAYWCAATEVWGGATDFGSPRAVNELCSTFDHDGDGYSKDDGDCNDADDLTYPGAPELESTKDNDCDGDIETMPVADIAVTSSTLFTCDPLQLDGTGSSDYEGSALTYEWELTSAPSGSGTTTADIVSTTDATPTFRPDLPGDYTFTLVVSDGGTESYPVSYTVTISTRPTNKNPVANAGPDQTGSSSSVCQAISYGVYYSCPVCDDKDFALDASLSTDPDGDELSYEWTFTGGSSYASIDDSTSSSPTVTVSNVPATYGMMTTQDVQLQLKVTDCMGAFNLDFIRLTLQCTGA